MIIEPENNTFDAIMVDISKLRIGGTISVGDVKTEEYTFLHPDNTSIVQVKASRNAVADDDEDEEEGAEGAEAGATPAAE